MWWVCDLFNPYSLDLVWFGGPVGGIGDGRRPGLVVLEVVGKFDGQLYCVFVGML